jgi:hypothetical protein
LQHFLDLLSYFYDLSVVAFDSSNHLVGMSGGGGGGGVREVGTVTAGMAMMNFDEKTRPYTRQDFLNFIQGYEENLNQAEKKLIETGLAATFIGLPLTGVVSYRLAKRIHWKKVETIVQMPKLVRFFPLVLSLSAVSIPYIVIQQWFIDSVLAMDDKQSNLSFHVKRLMVAQRSSMMFQRTATREVTREEQDALSREAVEHVASNRMANRPSSNGGMDVNLALGNQVMTPVAQTGYKPMNKN